MGRDHPVLAHPWEIRSGALGRWLLGRHEKCSLILSSYIVWEGKSHFLRVPVRYNCLFFFFFHLCKWKSKVMNVPLVIDLCQVRVRCPGLLFFLLWRSVITRLRGGRELKVNNEHPYFFSAHVNLWSTLSFHVYGSVSITWRSFRWHRLSPEMHRLWPPSAIPGIITLIILHIAEPPSPQSPEWSFQQLGVSWPAAAKISG